MAFKVTLASALSSGVTPSIFPSPPMVPSVQLNRIPSIASYEPQECRDKYHCDSRVPGVCPSKN